jgi:hypothetical protein
VAKSRNRINIGESLTTMKSVLLLSAMLALAHGSFMQAPHGRVQARSGRRAVAISCSEATKDAVVMEGEAAADASAESIFTMEVRACTTRAVLTSRVRNGSFLTVSPTSNPSQERNDGWDDVRSSLKSSLKDRSKAWEEVKSMYVEPTVELTKTTTRWTKAIVETIVEDAGATEKPKPAPKPAPKSMFVSAPAPPQPKRIASSSGTDAKKANGILGAATTVGIPLLVSVLDSAIAAREGKEASSVETQPVKANALPAFVNLGIIAAPFVVFPLLFVALIETDPAAAPAPAPAPAIVRAAAPAPEPAPAPAAE